MDLNHGPSGYEPDELPDCSTPRCFANITHLSGIAQELHDTQRLIVAMAVGWSKAIALSQSHASRHRIEVGRQQGVFVVAGTGEGCIRDYGTQKLCADGEIRSV